MPLEHCHRWLAYPGRLLCVLTVLLSLAACSKEPLYQKEAQAFGGRLKITIWGLPDELAARHANAVIADMQRLDAKLGSGPRSAVSALNATLLRGEPVQLDEELQEILAQGSDVELRSDGLFPAATTRMPATSAVQAASAPATEPAMLRSAGLAALHLDGNQLSGDGATTLRLDHVAQGWALDRMAAYLRRHRVFNALLQLDGATLALGKRGETRWKAVIPSQKSSTPLAMLALKSGEAFAYASAADTTLAVDPKTGKSARKVQLAAALTPATLQATALAGIAAKTAFVAGLDGALRYAGRYGTQEALIVANDDSIYVTAGLQQRLEWQSRPAHLYRLR
ncbi:hypothetical protein IGB42_00770 [Andreprevotia sp. IGB-42]|uniref:FAD:protein FMN transferase n=1 Tax=Andreprevotia sp. IGB-42 TaxID=2497473 RepID=UPI0013585E9A|nr:FAD:protein FMN transferase [Andreprevotia sp. IGB-42]KAF0814715.1 hypothetical protein IGB42_00770 [Andreprevotia sp. IGB-42]